MSDFAVRLRYEVLDDDYQVLDRSLIHHNVTAIVNHVEQLLNKAALP